jgi:CPA2 family monovalent cation:H+ antiporter-2
MRFLINFNERESKSSNQNAILTPWDTHIATFELNAQSPLVGNTLSESKIRERFGVNIVVIERDDFVINVPGRDTHLYPHDTLSVIGTDEQIGNFETFLESNKQHTKSDNYRTQVSLHHFTLSKKSPLLGKTISSSRIRERTQGLIIGIERNGKRILNPESDLAFNAHDKIWIAGNEKRILLSVKEFSGCEVI